MLRIEFSIFLHLIFVCGTSPLKANRDLIGFFVSIFLNRGASRFENLSSKQITHHTEIYVLDGGITLHLLNRLCFWNGAFEWKHRMSTVSIVKQFHSSESELFLYEDDSDMFAWKMARHV